MSSSYLSQDSENQSRQLEVQTVTIPFTLTANTSASLVTLTTDEPARLFLASAGVNNITPALAVNETATYTTGPNDASGILNALFAVNETVLKVMRAQVTQRNTTGQSGQGAYLGNALVVGGNPQGVTSGTGGGQKIMIIIDTGLNHTTTNVDACLSIDYIVQTTNA